MGRRPLRNRPAAGSASACASSGYVDGRNVVFDWRYAEGRPERLPALAAELVAANVDVIVTGGPGPLAAARQATRRIPIVTVSGSDPDRRGLGEQPGAARR